MENKPSSSPIPDNNSSLSENQLLSKCREIQEMTREKMIQLLKEQDDCLMKLVSDFVYQRQNSESNDLPNVQNNPSSKPSQEDILKELIQIKLNLKQKKMLDGLKNTKGNDLVDTTYRVLAKIFSGSDIAAGINWSGNGKNNKIGIKDHPEIIDIVRETVRKQYKKATDPEIEKIITKWFQKMGKTR